MAYYISVKKKKNKLFDKKIIWHSLKINKHFLFLNLFLSNFFKIQIKQSKFILKKKYIKKKFFKKILEKKFELKHLFFKIKLFKLFKQKGIISFFCKNYQNFFFQKMNHYNLLRNNFSNSNKYYSTFFYVLEKNV